MESESEDGNDRGSLACTERFWPWMLFCTEERVWSGLEGEKKVVYDVNDAAGNDFNLG